MKKINFKKYVNFDFVKRFSFNPKKYIGLSFKKLIDFNFKKYIYFTFKKYSKFRILFLYLLGVFVILPTIYLSIPTFFDYEKSKKLIEDKIYSDFNLKSSIEGKIKYRFFPSPRIKVENLIIKDFLDGKKNLGEVELASIKIPIKNLATFDKMIFKELELKNPLIYVDMNKSKKYKEYFSKHFKSKDIKISDATIKLSDGTNSIATIEKTKIQYDSKEKLKEATLKGKIFNKSILINFKNKIDSNTPNVIFIKYPSLNFRTSIVLYKPDESNNVEGKASFFINRFKGNFFFDLKEDLIKIKKGNIRNKFFNGKILGDISFLPFFNFDLDLNLFSLNFRSLSKVLMQMSNEDINCNELSDYESDNESDNESDYESDYESDNESDNKSELSDTELYEDNVWSTIDSYLPYVIILGGIVYAIKLFYYRKLCVKIQFKLCCCAQIKK